LVGGEGFAVDASLIKGEANRQKGIDGPCVDGSELARTFFTSAALVGAAMCSAY
jgi:hypothetical protein